MTVKAVIPAPPLQESQRDEQKALGGASFVELLRLERLRAALGPSSGIESASSPNPVVRILLEAVAGSSSSQSAALPKNAAKQPSASAGTPPPDKHETQLDEIIARASRSNELDPRLIKAVIQAESGGNADAVSPVGAQGLMQLMPQTSKELGVADPFDPEQNVMAGSRFLKALLDRYGGNLDAALAAYNWGPGRVDRGGVLPRETRKYVARVTKGYREFVG